MGKALYRKYRSKSLSEIVGQEHITKALSNALKHGNISHAYLFTGPRGVGKTSIARIMAHEINGFAYDETKTYMDIIEIDAASNRRIDEIRDLRDKVHTSPTEGKYKVYIIDEVHMLTKEAFNALLKTLEEPPAHAIFILATTEAHKLPDTIISRTQRYTFKPVEQKKAVDHLRHIAKQEGISVDEDAYESIAKHGDGSFRDSISLLDQLANNQANITLESVQNVLGIASNELIDSIIDAISKGNIATIASTLHQLKIQGAQPAQTSQQLSDYLRNMLVEGSSNLSSKAICILLKELIEVAPSRNASAMLEVVLFQATIQNQATETPQPKPAKKTANQQTPKPAQTPIFAKPMAAKKQQITTKPMQKKSEMPKKAVVEPDKTSQPTSGVEANVWELVMQDLKKSYNTLYSVVRMAQTTMADGSLELIVDFPFHQKRLSDNKNKQIIIDLLQKHTGTNYSVVSKTGPSSSKQPKKASNPVVKGQESGINNVTNIFGGGEVLD